MSIHDQCIRHIALNEGLSISDAQFKYRKMRSGRRAALKRKVRELYERANG